MRRRAALGRRAAPRQKCILMHALNTQAVRILDYVVNQSVNSDVVDASLRQIRDELLLAAQRPAAETPIDAPPKRRHEAFDYKDTAAYRMLADKFGSSVRQQDLVQIACCLSKKIGVKVERDAKRRKDLLIRWFQENIEKVSALLPMVVAFGKDGRVLKKDDVKEEDFNIC